MLDIIFYGTGGVPVRMDYNTRSFSGHFNTPYEGIANNLLRRFNETDSDMVKAEISRYMKQVPCTACGGKRLKPEALSVTVGGKNIHELCCMPVGETQEFLDALELGKTEAMIAERILKEIKARLRFLTDVGLGYLTLARASASLSGGESQRIRLATQIGSGLTGVLYILDEPSIGLHQKDNGRLLASLKGLRDLGNTLIVVEHDEETMREADYIVDIGPRRGRAWRRSGGCGQRGRHHRRAAVDHGQVSLRRTFHPRSRRAAEGWRRRDRRARRCGEQSCGHRCRLPDGGVHGGHRRVGERQIQPRQRSAVPGAVQRAHGHSSASRRRSRRGRRGISRQGHRHRPEPP